MAFCRKLAGSLWNRKWPTNFTAPQATYDLREKCSCKKIVSFLRTSLFDTFLAVACICARNTHVNPQAKCHLL